MLSTPPSYHVPGHLSSPIMKQGPKRGYASLGNTRVGFLGRIDILLSQIRATKRKINVHADFRRFRE